jgi:hypothetical protein
MIKCFPGGGRRRGPRQNQMIAQSLRIALKFMTRETVHIDGGARLILEPRALLD